jgi:hypothetical protein
MTREEEKSVCHESSVYFSAVEVLCYCVLKVLLYVPYINKVH